MNSCFGSSLLQVILSDLGEIEVNLRRDVTFFAAAASKGQINQKNKILQI